jgi:type IV secretion system protein TrbL
VVAGVQDSEHFADGDAAPYAVFFFDQVEELAVEAALDAIDGGQSGVAPRSGARGLDVGFGGTGELEERQLGAAARVAGAAARAASAAARVAGAAARVAGAATHAGATAATACAGSGSPRVATAAGRGASAGAVVGAGTLVIAARANQRGEEEQKDRAKLHAQDVSTAFLVVSTSEAPRAG